MVATAGCLWSERCQRRVAAPGELLEGAMEHRLTAGVRNVDALLSVVGKGGKVSSVPMESAQPGSLGHGWGAGRDPKVVGRGRVCRESCLSAQPGLRLSRWEGLLRKDADVG